MSGVIRRMTRGRKSVSGAPSSSTPSVGPNPAVGPSLRRSASVSAASGSRRRRDDALLADHVDEIMEEEEAEPEGIPHSEAGTSTLPTQESGFGAEGSHAEGDPITTAQIRAATFKYWFTKGPREPAWEETSCSAKCNFCGTVYKHPKGGGYGNYGRHIRTKHPEKLGLARGQTQLTGYASSSSQPAGLWSYDYRSCHDNYAEMIAAEGLAYSFSQRLCFNDFITQNVQPAWQGISRNTVKRKILRRYNTRKNELIEYFHKNQDLQVSICSDIWTDHWQHHSYMGVTCHWVDRSFQLHKRVLAFRVFDDAHTARNIARVLLTVLQEYRLTKRVFSIGFDNASANTASIPELIQNCQPGIGGKFFHIRCAPHILNLCVQDGLTYLQSVVEPIRFVLRALWRSKQLRQQWSAYCRSHQARPKQFPKDVCTRWNSTYKMIYDSIAYKDLLSGFATQNIEGSNIFGDVWTQARDVVEVFKVFYDATRTFSHVYMPTSNLFCFIAMNVAIALQDGINVPSISDAILEMRRKWVAYYKVIPDLFLVACCFDPRYKLNGVQKFLENYFPTLEIEEDPDCNVPIIVARVRGLLEELFTQYSTGDGPPSGRPPVPSSSSGSRTSITARTKALARDIFGSKRSRSSSSPHSELDEYLSTNFDFHSDEEEDFDVLQWWSRPERQRFPTLQVIARQILAAPCSTVAVEQLFSRGGQILSEKRSRLLPENLEAQVCLSDWKKAEMQMQKNILGTDSEDDDGVDTESVGSSIDGAVTDGSGGGGSDDQAE